MERARHGVEGGDERAELVGALAGEHDREVAARHLLVPIALVVLVNLPWEAYKVSLGKTTLLQHAGQAGFGHAYTTPGLAGAAAKSREVLARPDRGWTIAFVCTAASVLGGMFGYAIGYFLYETLGKWLIDLYGMAQGYEEFKLAYAKYGLWIILIKGLTPIPYKLVTIASGAAQFDLVVFILASIATRGVRFYAEVALLKIFGPAIRTFVEKYLTLVTTAFVVILVGGFVVAAKFL